MSRQICFDKAKNTLISSKKTARDFPTRDEYERMCRRVDDKPQRLTENPMCVSRLNSRDVFLKGKFPSIDIASRLAKFNWISEYLEKVNIKQFRLCIGDAQFSKYFENLGILGQGTFGTVRKVAFKANPNLEMVVKEALLENEDSMAITDLKKKWQTNRGKTGTNESKILFLVNNILLNNQAPFFLFTYAIAFCNTCQVENKPVRLNDYDSINNYGREYLPYTFCSNIFMERASSSLKDYSITLRHMSQEIVSEIMTSILQQLLIGLHILQYRYQIFHRDLETKNILILNVPHKQGYFKYTIDDKNYYVKNIGFLVCISDFGLSHSLHPLYCDLDGYLGQRNVEIVGDEMIPLIDSDNDKARIMWNPNGRVQDGTRNNVFLNSTYQFDRLTDWTDALKFPPEQFYLDIRDVLRLIDVEMKITSMSFQPSLQREIDILAYDQGHLLLRDLNRGSILLRADLMLAHLYVPPKRGKISVIREYCIR